MNPQTSICKYYFNPVDTYIKKCFTKSADLQIESYENFFDETGILSNVCNIEYQKNIKILYLQNKSDDHHIVSHFGPFVLQKNIVPVGDNSFIAGDSLGVHMGDWGKGHAPVDNIVLLNVFNRIISEASISQILRDLENGLDGTNKNTKDMHILTNHDYKLRVYVEKLGDSISVRLRLLYRGVRIKLPESLEIALYVLDENNKPLFKSKYENQLPKYPDYFSQTIRVRIFIKDKLGRTITAISPKV